MGPNADASDSAPAPTDALALRKAVEGLTYPSETDAPFDVFTWPGIGGTAENQVAHRAAGRPVEEISFDAFFGELRDTDEAPRFDALRRVIELALREVRVFRVGVKRVDVYLVGQTAAGQWSGLHTTSVET